MPARDVYLTVYIDEQLQDEEMGMLRVPGNLHFGAFMEGVAAPNTIFGSLDGGGMVMANRFGWREEYHIHTSRTQPQEGTSLPTEAASANAINRNQYYTATEGTQLGTAVDDVSHSVVHSGAFGIKGQKAGYYNIVSFKVEGKLVAMHADDDEDKVQKAESVREYKPNGKYRAAWSRTAPKLGTYTKSWPEHVFDFTLPGSDAESTANIFISYGFKGAESRGNRAQFFYYGSQDPGYHAPDLSIPA